MSPALIRQVLVDEADSFEKGMMARRALEPVLGDAILVADGARGAGSGVQPPRCFVGSSSLTSCPR